MPTVERIGDSLSWYPLVGAILGSVLAAFAWGLFAVLPPLPSGVLITLLWAVATGGLHLDGVSDACDALFSSRSRERALDIMKDPHIGVMGAIGIFGVLGAKATLVASLGGRAAPLVAACLLGRWAMTVAAATSRYARPEGGIASGIIQPAPHRMLLASMWLPLLFFARSSMSSILVAVLATAVFVAFARAVFYRKIGGLTGDCVGAIGEASEVLVLAVFAAG